MTKSAVIHKIEKMPDSLMAIVAEVLDKLMEGYELGKQEDWEEFTEEELDEFDHRYEAALNEPGSSILWSEVREQIRGKYGL